MGKCGPAVKYVVRLDAEERQQLEGIIRTGRGAAYRLLKARILLKADVSTEDCGWDDAQIAEAFEHQAAKRCIQSVANRRQV